MAIIKPNNNTISAITALPAAIPTGKVLQVVNASESVAYDITSTSYTNSSNGLLVNITPSSSSSKIFISVSIAYVYCPSGQNLMLTLYKDSTNLSPDFFALHSGFNEAVAQGYSFLDSPSTTSQVTYRVYSKMTGGAGIVGNANGESTITAFEIGA